MPGQQAYRRLDGRGFKDHDWCRDPLLLLFVFFNGQGRALQLPGEAADAVHSAEDDAREHQIDPGPVVRAGKRVVRAADRT